jgi:2-dehydro-3-deoxyglucarate aldolase
LNLKSKIRERKVTIGSWITLGHPSVAEILSTAGFDWLTIDCEHSVIDLDMVQQLILTIKSKNISALVRVGKNEEVVIKRVMDAGADGVIVPKINSKEEALEAVGYVKYPPVGNRGVGLTRAQNYGVGFNEYKNWVNSESIVIAQIEDIKAVNNIDEILLVKEIDGIIIGPYDLSASMGYPGEFERKEVIEAIRKVETACKKYSKSLGFHVILPHYQKLKEKIDAGYNFVAFSLDFYFLGEMARNELKKFREGQ